MCLWVCLFCYLCHKKDSYVKYVDVLIDMEVSIVLGNALVQNRLHLGSEQAW